MGTDDTVVFLGPSLPVAEARRILPARYLPPVRCGDVLRVRRMKPRAVAIIDGVFESVGAVWHKEILLALEDGIAVYGAASMGALRAAELAPFGMVGIGAIFEAYRDGVYTDDDEVALLQGPAAFGYPAMSEAMVNVRATAARAVEAGVIAPGSADRLVRVAKGIFYQERSLDLTVEAAWGQGTDRGEAARFRRFLEDGGYVNQKRLDAEALLRHVAASLPATPRPSAGVPGVNRSSFILRLQHQAMCGPFDLPAPDLPREEQVAAAAMQRGRRSSQLRRLAQMLAAAYALARVRQVPVTDTHRQRVFTAGDLGLGPAARTKRWAVARDLTGEACAALVDRLGVIQALQASFEHRVGRHEARRRYDAHLLDMMRIEGRYASYRPRGRASGRAVDRAVLRNAARRDGAAFALDRRAGVLRCLVADVVASMGVAPCRRPQELSDDFRRARGLERRAATLAWRRANNLDAPRYEALVEGDARVASVFGADEPHVLGLYLLADPVCWLLDAIRIAGMYGRLARRLCYGSREYEPATHSGRTVMAKAKAAAKKAVKKAAKKAAKDLAPKKAANVKGGAVRKKVYE